jgi:hypothetical protein
VCLRQRVHGGAVQEREVREVDHDVDPRVALSGGDGVLEGGDGGQVQLPGESKDDLAIGGLALDRELLTGGRGGYGGPSFPWRACLAYGDRGGVRKSLVSPRVSPAG